MILGIIICAVAQLMLIVFGSADFIKAGLAQEMVALFFGVSVIGSLLSIASIFLNISRIKTGSRTYGIIGVSFSSLALILYIYYLVLWYTSYVKATGGTLFTHTLPFQMF